MYRLTALNYSLSWITATIINQDVHSIEDDVHRGPVGEALKKSAQLGNRKVEFRILEQQEVREANI